MPLGVVYNSYAGQRRESESSVKKLNESSTVVVRISLKVKCFNFFFQNSTYFILSLNSICNIGLLHEEYFVLNIIFTLPL